ncbi:MAG: polysaccharide deacetylase family protein [candidate division WOR-3 bacterium]|nr:MAG: polysaccharide deacetylase family protein [candidate division WOR-3 bacterium]
MNSHISKLYETIYQRCPRSMKNALSRCSFEMTNKPWVCRSGNSLEMARHDNSKGVLVISADLELAWGWRYSKAQENPLEKALRTRANFPVLFRLFEEYNIPVTWATVGHLLLNSCGRSSHDWMHRIPFFENAKWSYRNGDWFDADPRTNWRKAEAWYAPDLIEKIVASKAEHEIGCHTFSHIDFSDSICPSSVAEDEVIACIAAAKHWDIDLRSFVFAAGTYGNYEVLKKHGFTNYRKRLRWELSQPSFDDHGLVVLPSSCALQGGNLGWSRDYTAYRLKKYIDRAVTSRTVCHFWFHPSFDGWFLNNVFPCVLKHAAELRDQNRLWIATMGQVAAHALRTKSRI